MQLSRSSFLIYPFLLLTILSILNCKNQAPVMPTSSLESYTIEEGFNLTIIASEPLLEAPVTMDFDNQGRIWVVQMRGYMPNLDGIGEEEPTGRITILEDLDKDGVFDHSKIFLDSLVLPRAIAHVYGGLLYVEPPNLWFVDIEDDKPGAITLVDSIYADAGNVEHQPNGLMVNIDNWIYNANSNFRYRLKNGKWEKSPTSYRGQWGITKDNFGRLYYNNNSTQLIGDYVLPNTAIRNSYFRPTASINKKLTDSQRVYPAHPTSVNRGYSPGTLDADSMLIAVTSACGPVIYRGNQFPDEYNLNAFVCVPEANLIKRNMLSFEFNKITAQQAVEGTEFLRSTDEGFRPVNLFNGPDGAMYIVDMHRGIIQHKAFITQYLINHLAQKQLDTLIGMGRILKVISKDNSAHSIPNLLEASNLDLVGYLSSPNGWLRDRAQQLLIQKKDSSGINGLKELAKSEGDNATPLHALYTLSGMDALSYPFLLNLLKSPTASPETKAHSLLLMEEFAAKEHIAEMAQVISDLLVQNNPLIDLYIAFGLNPWIKLSDQTFLQFAAKISQKYPEDAVVQEAITSSLSGFEEKYMELVITNEVLSEMLKEAINNKTENKINPIFTNVSVQEDARTSGLKLFKTICAACHGQSGEGIDGLAPPLQSSEYVSGSVHRLTSIILHGMSGPVHVNGKLYTLNSVMPGLAQNPAISDEDISDLIQYLQNAFVPDTLSKRINAEEIQKLREKVRSGGTMFTEEELVKMEFSR